MTSEASDDAGRLCPRCGRDNACGYGRTASCWCARESDIALPVPTNTQACYCADCLRELSVRRRSGSTSPELPAPEKGG